MEMGLDLFFILHSVQSSCAVVTLALRVRFFLAPGQRCTEEAGLLHTGLHEKSRALWTELRWQCEIGLGHTSTRG